MDGRHPEDREGEQEDDASVDPVVSLRSFMNDGQQVQKDEVGPPNRLVA